MKLINMKETWKDIEGYEGLYQVSNLGRVKSLFRYKKQLKLEITKNGYVRIMLCKNKKRKRHLVHRLVAEAFIPNPNNLPCVNHKDENKQNNCVDNLEFCTSKYNCNYGNRNTRISKNSKKQINQYDLDGNFIQSWHSIKEASDFYNISASAIVLCLENIHNTCGGYIWKYCKGESDLK